MMDLSPLTPAPKTGNPPLPAGAQLIFAQARHMEKAGGIPSKTTFCWKVTGPMDEAAMCRAMDVLALNRDYLHLGLATRDKEGVLLEARPEPVQVEAVAPENLAAETLAWSNRKDPESPACTLRLLKLKDQDYVIGLSGPHDLLDIWTIDQTLSCLAQLYADDLEGRHAVLSSAPGFRDYSHWYETLLASGRLSASKAFWQDLLADATPVFDLPPAPESDPSHPMAAVPSALPLDPDTCRAFEAKTRAAGGSVFEGYFTLFNLALFKITGKETLLSAFVASLRRMPGLGDVSGCMLNRFYIPVRLTRETDFVSAVQQVSGTLKSAKEHCLWPAWKEIDPQGTGYPGLFFHYVPPVKGEMPAFKDLSISSSAPVMPAHWPLPITFQVMADPKQPMLVAIGQAGFCSKGWLETLQRTCADLMAQV